MKSLSLTELFSMLCSVPLISNVCHTIFDRLAEFFWVIFPPKATLSVLAVSSY